MGTFSLLNANPLLRTYTAKWPAVDETTESACAPRRLPAPAASSQPCSALATRQLLRTSFPLLHVPAESAPRTAARAVALRITAQAIWKPTLLRRRTKESMYEKVHGLG